MKEGIEALGKHETPFDEFVKIYGVALYSLDELRERFYLFNALRCDFLHHYLSIKSPIPPEPGHGLIPFPIRKEEIRIIERGQ